MRTNRSLLILGSLAGALLVGQCGLIIWGRYDGKSWYEMWPTGLSGFAMLLVVISIVLRARPRDSAVDARRS